ncbi:50S ribosomal protein L25 [Patulibacter sp. S7RM1-6]
MATNSSSLAVASREPLHSRDARRARRDGRVPGVIYGGDKDPVSIAVDARELRNTLAAQGAVIDVAIDGGSTEPVVLKEAQRHPVRGDLMHVDLLRVNLQEKIQQVVPLELTDTEDGAGIKLGGILEQLVREVTVEALPTDIPEAVTLSVKDLEIGHHLTLGDAVVPGNGTLVDEAETIAVNLSAPRLSGAGVDEDEAAEGDEAPAEAADEAPAEDAE